MVKEKYELAGAGVRFASAIVDGFVIGVPGGLISAAIILSDSFGAKVIVYSLWLIFVAVVYYTILVKKWSATLGMKWLKIKLIDAKTHKDVGYRQAFVRYLVMATLSSWILGLGFAFMFFTKNKQNLHDLIAKTLVMKVK